MRKRIVAFMMAGVMALGLTGCGSVLNPGSVIGRNTNIYPLSSVRGVVPENSIYKNQNEIVVKK